MTKRKVNTETETETKHDDSNRSPGMIVGAPGSAPNAPKREKTIRRFNFDRTGEKPSFVKTLFFEQNPDGCKPVKHLPSLGDPDSDSERNTQEKHTQFSIPITNK